MIVNCELFPEPRIAFKAPIEVENSQESPTQKLINCNTDKSSKDSKMYLFSVSRKRPSELPIRNSSKKLRHEEPMVIPSKGAFDCPTTLTILDADITFADIMELDSLKVHFYFNLLSLRLKYIISAAIY